MILTSKTQACDVLRQALEYLYMVEEYIIDEDKALALRASTIIKKTAELKILIDELK